MEKSDFEIAAPQCDLTVSAGLENSLEILLRHASFATAGVPTSDVEHVLAMLLRPHSGAMEADEDSAVSRPASNAR